MPTGFHLPSIFTRATTREVHRRPLAQVVGLLIYEMIDCLEWMRVCLVPPRSLTKRAGEVVEVCLRVFHGGGGAAAVSTRAMNLEAHFLRHPVGCPPLFLVSAEGHERPC